MDVCVDEFLTQYARMIQTAPTDIQSCISDYLQSDLQMTHLQRQSNEILDALSKYPSSHDIYDKFIKLKSYMIDMVSIGDRRLSLVEKLSEKMQNYSKDLNKSFTKLTTRTNEDSTDLSPPLSTNSVINNNNNSKVETQESPSIDYHAINRPHRIKSPTLKSPSPPHHRHQDTLYVLSPPSPSQQSSRRRRVPDPSTTPKRLGRPFNRRGTTSSTRGLLRSTCLVVNRRKNRLQQQILRSRVVKVPTNRRRGTTTRSGRRGNSLLSNHPPSLLYDRSGSGRSSAATLVAKHNNHLLVSNSSSRNELDDVTNSAQSSCDESSSSTITNDNIDVGVQQDNDRRMNYKSSVLSPSLGSTRHRSRHKLGTDLKPTSGNRRQHRNDQSSRTSTGGSQRGERNSPSSSDGEHNGSNGHDDNQSTINNNRVNKQSEDDDQTQSDRSQSPSNRQVMVVDNHASTESLDRRRVRQPSSPQTLARSARRSTAASNSAVTLLSSSSSTVNRQQPRRGRTLSQSSTKSVAPSISTTVADKASTTVNQSSSVSSTDDHRVYCLCKKLSYGDMVACDNKACPVEWFHFSCVGLTQSPKGKWFCPFCRGESSRCMR